MDDKILTRADKLERIRLKSRRCGSQGEGLAYSLLMEVLLEE
jgi:hypothetical protein